MNDIIRQIEPWIDDAEVAQLRKIGETTYVTEGPLTAEFERRFRDQTGARHVTAYANGTLAQFGILKAMGIGPGDEVIVPAMTFIATCNAVILTGATPVLCDVDRTTLGLDPTLLGGKVTDRTKAIVVVHLYGGAADMDEISAFAAERGIAVVEDAAQAVGVRYRNKYAGTLGDAGYLSFYGNKTMTTGEGAVILTDDDHLAEQCYRLKNHGRAEKGTFIHDQIGFNFCFTDIQAAVGLAQLDKLDEIVRRKNEIYAFYNARLADIDGVEMHRYGPDVSPVPWFTNIYVDDAGALSEFLGAKDIGSRRYFYPLHRQPCYADGPVRLGDCPQSDWAYDHGLSLPSTVTLTEAELGRVCAVVEEYCG